LFRLERRVSFQRFTELLLAQSGGIFEATKFAAPCEVSRSTIANYLAALEATAVAPVLRPFSSRRSNEIVAAPKVYGFDTGFVCAFRGWTSLRPEDLGRPWEYYVLNELVAHRLLPALRFWRDKQGHEVDFVWAPRGRTPLAIECKWSARDFDPANLTVFARAYPRHELLVVTTDAHPAFTREYDGRPVHFLDLERLVQRLAQPDETEGLSPIRPRRRNEAIQSTSIRRNGRRPKSPFSLPSSGGEGRGEEAVTPGPRSVAALLRCAGSQNCVLPRGAQRTLSLPARLDMPLEWSGSAPVAPTLSERPPTGRLPFTG
jgi:hypothetical protein